MSDPAHKNVVNMEAYGQLRRGLGTGPGKKVLQDIRDTASRALQQHLGRMMEKTDDALFARAEKADNNSAQTLYFDAMREIRIIRKDIEQDCIDTLTSQFNRGIPRETVTETGSLNLDWENDSSIGLVGAEQLEEDLARNNMVTKVRGTCSQSLFSLDKRIGFLIQDPDLEHWQNPLGPEAICDAFRTAARRIETGIEIRLVIYKLFDQHVISHLDDLYKEINQRLIQAGVLPEIKATVRKHRNHAHPATGSQPGTPGGYHPAPASEGQPPAGAGAHGAEFSSSSVTGNGIPFAGVSYAAVQPSINALTFLQQGILPSDPVTEMQVGSAMNPADVTSGQVNVLHGMKGTPMIQDLGRSGDMTIDIVAMLFDYILDDKSIPDALRALIGRLQIPVLKVSLLDREFFARKSHPARQLLNRLAATGVDCDEESGDHDPLFRKVSSIVQTIIDEFEDDVSLFERLLTDLDNFLNKDEEKAEIRAERSARVMEGQERLDIAKSTTMRELEPRLNNNLNLDFVREFVSTKWKNLLFVTCARHGKDSEVWKQTVSTMDDLIWSIKPKSTPEDRARLVSIQPGLLQSLREGMERLSMPVTERDDFIARLVRAHGRTAANQEDEKDGSAADSASDSVTEEAPPVEAKTPVKVESPDIEDSFTARARRLKAGDWLQFTDADGNATQAKLSWVSPITGTYLFTDRQGLKAGNYTPVEIAEIMRSGNAKALNATPLMDRAVSTVLREYQKN